MITKNDIIIPLTVPKNKKIIYIKNYLRATKNSGKLFIFSGDQKIEHLNKDFYGPAISLHDASPKHLFEIASRARIGAFATQLGLIARYGEDYSNINYIIKINSKTNLPKSEPLSLSLYPLSTISEFIKNSKLNIVGLGYTVYIGSEYESKMLSEAAQVVYTAHKNGLLAILWIYPRGSAIINEKTAEIIAGAAGVGACLGSDFIKINPPENQDGEPTANLLKQVVLAAGRSKIVCSGGEKKDEGAFLKELSEQIIMGSSGTATGRNIHQRDLSDAVRFCEKIAKIVIDGELNVKAS